MAAAETKELRRIGGSWSRQWSGLIMISTGFTMQITKALCPQHFHQWVYQQSMAFPWFSYSFSSLSRHLNSLFIRQIYYLLCLLNQLYYCVSNHRGGWKLSNFELKISKGLIPRRSLMRWTWSSPAEIHVTSVFLDLSFLYS